MRVAQRENRGHCDVLFPLIGLSSQIARSTTPRAARSAALMLRARVQLAPAPEQRGPLLWTWDGQLAWGPCGLLGRFPVRMVVAGYSLPHGKTGLVVLSPLEPTEQVCCGVWNCVALPKPHSASGVSRPLCRRHHNTTPRAQVVDWLRSTGDVNFVVAPNKVGFGCTAAAHLSSATFTRLSACHCVSPAHKHSHTVATPLVGGRDEGSMPWGPVGGTRQPGAQAGLRSPASRRARHAAGWATGPAWQLAV
jgi:hypothetical protein